MTSLITSIRKFSTNVFSNIFISNETKMFIGRWSTPHKNNNKENINIIIDRNNEDHCGCCIINKLTSIKYIEVDNEYYKPYFL